LTLDGLFELHGFTPTEGQREAIISLDGPLFLMAGPGSGKTRVLKLT
jgi:DNA helicase-2/ATP-dependent DNA helicase PcrA